MVVPDEIIDDDLYAFGWTIETQGRVNGDVFAFGNRVVVGGTVTASACRWPSAPSCSVSEGSLASWFAPGNLW